jgi:transketolase
MVVSTRVNDTVVNTIKTLSMDAVQRANSGHPGMPMGTADMAAVLWCEHLMVDPTTPDFMDRDRFILSAGHGSMLLYSLLHLSGFDLSMDDLKNFRQLHSKTPGHPEVGLTAGVETTTGPLGQGFTNGVGMAMAEAYLAAMFNRPGFPIVDHYTYAICSDGDLQEGISHEAAGMAGHLGLGKIIYLYDDNEITIEGATGLSDSTDATARFESYGWHVIQVDGHDREAVHRAIEAAKAETTKPSLIRCRTHIGHGSPNKQDSEKSHGSPLGAEEIRLTKAGMGWPEDSSFLVEQGAYDAFASLRTRGADKRVRWESMFKEYRINFPDEAAQWDAMFSDEPQGQRIIDLLPTFDTAAATRASSGKVINAIASALPGLWGGSADLAGSNKTEISAGDKLTSENKGGRNIHYGIREHGMAGIMNGMALHGGIIPYGGTFLTFTDYMRGSMRLSALMKQRVVYVLSHDSIFLGEDGPTHQSIEHAMALRLIPDMDVIRPADGAETAAAWVAALDRTDGPSSLLLTRQGVPPLTDTKTAIEGVARGGYILQEASSGAPKLILMGTGSETHLCVEAAAILEQKGVPTRVVSMPCLDRFDRQSDTYKEQVLPSAVRCRLSVEAGRTFGWERYVGLEGGSVGIDRFGESAPAGELAEYFGFTVNNVLAQAQVVLAKNGQSV